MNQPTSSVVPSAPATVNQSQPSGNLSDSLALNIPGPKVLLMGDSGTGKTSSIPSLINQGITPFCIATEQNFMQILKPYLGKGIHYKYIPSKNQQSPAALLSTLKQINMLSYENLTKSVDPMKVQNNRLIDVGESLNSFVCDCCKKNWGSPTQWKTDRALIYDGMSGLSDMAFNLVVGNKPVRAPPDYQVAQQALSQILEICVSMQCMFVLIAHLAKEQDPVSGAYFATVNTVGKALGPDLPRRFSDCIRAKRNGAAFTWDTADAQATVVGRHLPLAGNMDPTFNLLVSNWLKQGGKIEPTL